MMITLSRDIHGQFDSMRHGGWQTRPGYGLAGKTLGLLGLGRLGGVVAAAGNVLRMKVIAWSQNLTDQRAAECNARRVEKDELFRRSDVLSIHLILSERTRGIVGTRELGLMAPTAYLINTSRGPIVDEAALLKTLKERGLRGRPRRVRYGATAGGGSARKLDNVLLTPHVGYAAARKPCRNVSSRARGCRRISRWQTIN
jgi:phosphoglycerate dehydrogenase-like enzyme